MSRTAQRQYTDDGLCGLPPGGSGWPVLWWAIVAGASTLAAGALLTVRLPDAVRLVATLHVVLFWPGLAAIVAILRRADLAIVDFLALGLPASAGVIAIEAFAAYALHPTMGTMLYCHTAVCLALSAAGLVRLVRLRSEAASGKTEAGCWRISLDKAALGLIVVFAIVFWPAGRAAGPDLREGIDGYFHLGYMAKMACGERISADCAFFQGAGTDSRYPFSASLFGLGMLVGFAGLPLLKVWAALSRLVPILLLPPIYLFTKQAFSHRPLALAVLLLWAGTAFACKPFSAPFFCLLWRDADPKYIAAYPYPNSMCVRLMLPCLAALAAAYLRQPRGPLLLLAALIAFGAAQWHVMALVWVPLFLGALVCVCAAARVGAREALSFFAVCCAAILPSAVLVVLAHPGHLPAGFVGLQEVRFLEGGRWFVVAPKHMFTGVMIGGAIAAAAVLLSGAESPSALVVAASVVFVPLLNLNPPVASALWQVTTPSLLRRLYAIVPVGFFSMVSIVAVPVALARLLEWAGGSRSARMRACAAAIGVMLLVAAIPLLDWLEGLMRFWRLLPRPSLAGPMAAGIAIVAVVIARAIFGRRIAGLRLLPRKTSANVLMVALAGGIVAVRALAPLGPEPWPCRCRTKINSLKRFPRDRATGEPLFLQRIAKGAPPFTRVVYSSDPYAAEITPAFAHQFTVYYDENANPRVDLRARQRDHAMIGDPEVPPDETLALLRHYRVGYVVTTKYTPAEDAKFRGLSWPFTPIYRDASARVYRVNR